jgi:hypothetical protein
MELMNNIISVEGFIHGTFWCSCVSLPLWGQMKPQDMHRHPFNNQNIAIVEMQFLLPIPRLGQVELLQVVVIYQMCAHMTV